MACHAVWVGRQLRVDIDGIQAVFEPFDGREADIQALGDAVSQLLTEICGATLMCITEAQEKAKECMAAADEAVNRRLFTSFDPVYGLDVDEFDVERSLFEAKIERIVVYQAGYMVVLPPGLKPSLLRDPEAEVEIDGVRMKAGELLRRLGIDPEREYRFARVTFGRIRVYLTTDAKFLVTSHWIPPGGTAELFVHGKALSLDDIAGRLSKRGVEVDTSVVYTRAAAILRMKRESVARREAIYAEPYAPLTKLREVAQRVEEAVEEVGKLDADKALVAAYLAVAPGGHVGYAIPHALIVTPPATGKSLMAERLCIHVFSRLTEASILGGANVAKGTTFNSILDGRYACVQVEHAENVKQRIIHELLSLMASGRAERGVYGHAVKARVYSPIVFTGNVRGKDPLNEAVSIISILTSNAQATGRRFGIVLVSSNVRRWEPSEDEIGVLERLGLVKYIIENPVVHSKLERAYKMVMAEVEYALPGGPPSTGSMVLDEFLEEYYEHGVWRLVHAALNLVTLENIRMVVDASVDELYEVYSSRVMDALDALAAIYERTLEFLTRGRPSDFDAILRSLPKYVAQAALDITAGLEEALRNGGNTVRFSDVYNRKKYGKHGRRRIVTMIARYAKEFKEALEAWARQRECEPVVKIGEDDVVVEVVCRGVR